MPRLTGSAACLAPPRPVLRFLRRVSFRTVSQSLSTLPHHPHPWPPHLPWMLAAARMLRARISSLKPGARQKPRAVRHPAVARVRSKRLGWVSRTRGPGDGAGPDRRRSAAARRKGGTRGRPGRPRSRRRGRTRDGPIPPNAPCRRFLRPLDGGYSAAMAGQLDRRGQAVWAGANDVGVGPGGEGRGVQKFTALPPPPPQLMRSTFAPRMRPALSSTRTRLASARGNSW
jgi:hypothetical protein